MNTITLQAEIQSVDMPLIEQILKRFKAKNVTFKKDDTEMTKTEFFSMIDEARKSKKHKISLEEMQKMLLED